MIGTFLTYTMGLVFTGAIVLGARQGVVRALEGHRAAGKPRTAGWLFFAAGSGTAVKVGVTKESPTKADLPDNLHALRFLLKKQVPDTEEALRAIDAEIGQYQVRNRWYDRDAAMYYIDHLKGLT